MCAGVSLDDVLKLVQVVFYVVSPFIALYGLRSWRRELQGRSEHEVATEILAGAYRIRDAIKDVQAPFMTPREWASRERKQSESEFATETYNSFYAYSNRYQGVRDAISAWHPHVVRAEALFGAEAKAAMTSLAKLCNKLWFAIEMWHQNEIRTEGRGQKMGSLYNIMLGINRSEHPELPAEESKDNGFHDELFGALARIDALFIPHVRGHRPGA
jgi:hypothetical protein